VPDRPGSSTEVQRELGLAGRLLAGAAVGLATAVPFLVLLLLVRSGSGQLAEIDGDVARGLTGWVRQHPAVVDALRILAEVTAPTTFRVLVLVAAALLWHYGRRRIATWAIVTMAVGSAFGVLAKLAVGRARPVLDEPVATAPGLSFPSGHALNSMLGVVILLVVLLPVLHRRGRVIAWTLGVLAVGVTAFDRVGLGVHFLTDVLAGWSAALALAAGTATAFGTWRRRHPAVLDEAELEVQRGTAVRLHASLHAVAAVLGRALLAAAVLIAVMVALGLLVTRVLVDLSALSAVRDLPSDLAADRSAAGRTLSDVFSRLADTSTIVPVMLAVCIALRRVLHRWREAAFVLLAVSLQSLVFVTTQLVVARTRPDVVALDPAAPTSSFPSGHTSAAVALYGGLAVVLLWRAAVTRVDHARAVRAMRVAALVLLLVPVAVAWSRLYRGLHFPLDVAAAFVQAAMSLAVAYRLVLVPRSPGALTDVLDGTDAPSPVPADSAPR
jgi:undecaprenyl-diphosphatase